MSKTTSLVKKEYSIENLKNQYILHRIIQRVNSVLHLEILLDQTLYDIADTFGYSRVAVLIYDRNLNQLKLAAINGWSKGKYKKGDMFSEGTGLVWEVVKNKKLYYAPDVNKEDRYFDCNPSTKSELNIPLFSRNKFLGILNVQNIEADGFSTYNIELLEILGMHIANAIENSRLFEKERQEKFLMQSELEEAKEIQTKLFPRELLFVEDYKLEGLCEPCKQVGGDWFDFIELKSGKTGIVVADISGKGIGAALLMTSARSILRLYAEENDSPSLVLEKVNSKLYEDFPSSKFVSAVYAVLDPFAKTITISNAGTMPPLYKDNSGARYIKLPPSLPLGVRLGAYPETIINIPKGSSLLLYTDGVTEAINENNKNFGEERLQEYFTHKNFTVNTLLNNIKKFVGGQNPHDDITLLSISSA